jgi:hypothetical protein
MASSVQVREGPANKALGSIAFSGSGLNDMSRSGVYTGSLNATYYVVIDGEGAPDTFKWSNDGGSTFEATGVSITGSAQTLERGVSITFAATTGHTDTENWTFTARKNFQSIGVITTASTEILATDSNRKYLRIENISDTDIWVRLDGETATAAAPAVFIAKTSGTLEFKDQFIPTASITAIHGGSGDKNTSILSY